MPSVMAFGDVLVVTNTYRLWFGSRTRDRRPGRGTLPRWPTSPDDASPSLVVGEIHHPTEPREIRRPAWLTIPRAGPVYRGRHLRRRGDQQDLRLHASLRPAAPLVAVRGPAEAGRRSRPRSYQRNPLASAMDTYSLA